MNIFERKDPNTTSLGSVIASEMLQMDSITPFEIIPKWSHKIKTLETKNAIKNKQNKNDVYQTNERQNAWILAPSGGILFCCGPKFPYRYLSANL